jgi:7-carboxy-7-deazaguanine synthase
MTYSVKEIFYSLQGEGTHAGRPAVFCRFSGCNLWSGRETDRKAAVCQFCDTDFVGTDGTSGGKYTTAVELAETIASLWPSIDTTHAFVVCTGGEPLMQVNEELIEALHNLDFEIAIETNGTIGVPQGIDWICVSPKSDANLVVGQGHELKLVFPQKGVNPAELEKLSFDHFLLQPMDGPDRLENAVSATNYCLAHPSWKLSLQTHKQLGIR